MPFYPENALQTSDPGLGMAITNFTTMPGMGTMDMMMALHVMSPLKKFSFAQALIVI